MDTQARIIPARGMNLPAAPICRDLRHDSGGQVLFASTSCRELSNSIPIMKKRARISKSMSCILRHNPMGPDASPEGLMLLDGLVNRLQEQYRRLDRRDVEDMANRDEKGGFDLKCNRTGARYGHSSRVTVEFPLPDIETLYHGASRPIAERILRDGFKPVKRKKVHLTRSIEDVLPLSFTAAHSALISMIIGV